MYCSHCKLHFSIFEAKCYNWNMLKAGDLVCTEWIVKSDRSFCRKEVYNPTIDDIISIMSLNEHKKSFDSLSFRRCMFQNGEMNQSEFSELLDVLERGAWRDFSIDYPAYDGEGWEFRQYDTEGRIVCDSGRRIYIYGNSILEKIAQLLP